MDTVKGIKKQITRIQNGTCKGLTDEQYEFILNNLSMERKKDPNWISIIITILFAVIATAAAYTTGIEGVKSDNKATQTRVDNVELRTDKVEQRVEKIETKYDAIMTSLNEIQQSQARTEEILKTKKDKF